MSEREQSSSLSADIVVVAVEDERMTEKGSQGKIVARSREVIARDHR